MSDTAEVAPLPTPVPTYQEKRAKQRTRREERAAKRVFESLKGKVRSQLRQQLDQIMTPNINDLILALASGKGIRLQIEVGEMKEPESEAAPAAEEPPKRPLIIVP